MDFMTLRKGRQSAANIRVRVRSLALLPLLCLVQTIQITHADMLSSLFGNDQPITVDIADPYIELHTDAGEGYPVFHVEERGARIEILKRKTDWFKVRTDKGKEGWVAREQLERTLTPAGQHMEIRDATRKEFAFHRWEMGAMGGDFEHADVLSVYHPGTRVRPNGPAGTRRHWDPHIPGAALHFSRAVQELRHFSEHG
jgi:hypothetical protein